MACSPRSPRARTRSRNSSATAPTIASTTAAGRADEARCFLDHQGYTPDAWQVVVRETSGVPTTLAPLGREITAMLLEHGYVLTLVNMYVMHGLGELRPIDRTRFPRLAAGICA